MEAKDKRPSKAKLKSTAAARNAVFDTAELLENIVLLLPPRQVLVIKSVCRQFRTIVATSPALQEMLFLKPSNKNGASEKWTIVAKNCYSHYKDFQAFEFAVSPVAGSDTKILVEGLNVVTPNLMVVAPPAHEEFPYTSGGHVCHIYARPNESEVLRLQRDIQDLILCPESVGTESWQHMNITDPPCTSAKLEIKFRFDGRPYVRIIDITAYDKSGITMNKLLHNATTTDSDSRHFQVKIFETTTGYRQCMGKSVRQLLDDMLRPRSRNSKKRLESMNLWLPGTVAATEEEREKVKRELTGRKDDGNEAP